MESSFESQDKISKFEKERGQKEERVGENGDEDRSTFYAAAVSLAFIYTAKQPKSKVLRTGKIKIISHTKFEIFS